MSQVTMTIIGPDRAIHGHPHASCIDEVVAALSADPETIEELEAAMARFVEPDGRGPFAGWSSGMCDEPCDAGVCIIDLGARLVVAESTYSTPIQAGQVQYRYARGRSEDDPWVTFHLADDWKLRFDAVDWDAEAEMRRNERLAAGPLDFRKVLYGRVCRFIVEQCLAARAESAASGDWTPPAGWTFTELPERAGKVDVPLAEHAVAEIHARWLMTPRDDLRGQAPRDVLLAGRGHIDWNLQDRGEQWSVFRACPPGLSRESAAFRFGPCGTHENVLYYDLGRFEGVVRHPAVHGVAQSPFRQPAYGVAGRRPGAGRPGGRAILRRTSRRQRRPRRPERKVCRSGAPAQGVRSPAVGRRGTVRLGGRYSVLSRQAPIAKKRNMDSTIRRQPASRNGWPPAAAPVTPAPRIRTSPPGSPRGIDEWPPQ